ncbi:MAG: hypothetical protein FJ404_08590 [Verrucomicrobia bacterium]|nr:hypothetical protein [Verrucomicrobiota bacterium]
MTDPQAAALCGDVNAAQDLVQETLIEAWRGLPRFRGGCKFFTWLCSMMIHRHLKGCSACQSYFKEMSALAICHQEAARALPAVEIWPRVYSRVTAAVRRRPRYWPGEVLAVLGRRWVPVAAAASIGLLLAGGGLWSFRRPRPAPKSLAAGPISIFRHALS